VDGRERDFEASENEVQVVRRGDRPANQLRDLLTSGPRRSNRDPTNSHASPRATAESV
jgi:hypothetical protein